MIITDNCTIEIQDNLLKLSTSNGRIVAEILVEGPFEVALYNCIKNVPIEKGRVNIFRGELIVLNKDEFLDVKTREIKTRE